MRVCLREVVLMRAHEVLERHWRHTRRQLHIVGLVPHGRRNDLMSYRTVNFFQTTRTPNRCRSHEVAIRTTGLAPLRRPITDGTVERFADGSFSNVPPRRVKSCRAASSYLLSVLEVDSAVSVRSYSNQGGLSIQRLLWQSQMNTHFRSRASADSWKLDPASRWARLLERAERSRPASARRSSTRSM